MVRARSAQLSLSHQSLPRQPFIRWAADYRTMSGAMRNKPGIGDRVTSFCPMAYRLLAFTAARLRARDRTEVPSPLPRVVLAPLEVTHVQHGDDVGDDRQHRS